MKKRIMGMAVLSWVLASAGCTIILEIDDPFGLEHGALGAGDTAGGGGTNGAGAEGTTWSGGFAGMGGVMASGGAGGMGGEAGAGAGAGGGAPVCVPAAESCDGMDNDCDGDVDEGCPPCTDGMTQPCYDGPVGTKGVGQCVGGTQTCLAGTWGACIEQTTPDSAESCNGIDDDCDGSPDEGLGSLTCGMGACFVVVDACVNGQSNTCTPGSPTSEICDKIDNNCNGMIDEGVQTHYCQDADSDGYGNPNSTRDECAQPAGYVLNCSDCNDGNSAAHPDNVEICNDGVDNDCNGVVDMCVCAPTTAQSCPLVLPGCICPPICARAGAGTEGSNVKAFSNYNPSCFDNKSVITCDGLQFCKLDGSGWGPCVDSCL